MISEKQLYRDLLGVLARFSPEQPIIVPPKMWKYLKKIGVPLDNVREQKPIPTKEKPS